jgi:hypothetical protein
MTTATSDVSGRLVTHPIYSCRSYRAASCGRRRCRRRLDAVGPRRPSRYRLSGQRGQRSCRHDAPPPPALDQAPDLLFVTGHVAPIFHGTASGVRVYVWWVGLHHPSILVARWCAGLRGLGAATLHPPDVARMRASPATTGEGRARHDWGVSVGARTATALDEATMSTSTRPRHWYGQILRHEYFVSRKCSIWARMVSRSAALARERGSV